jgi:hypothetical protein
MASGAVDAAAEAVAALGISAAGGDDEWAQPSPALRRNLRLLSHDQVTKPTPPPLLALLALLLPVPICGCHTIFPLSNPPLQIHCLLGTLQQFTSCNRKMLIVEFALSESDAHNNLTLVRPTTASA